jgi:DNA-binding PadR family transcriptional regulator
MQALKHLSGRNVCTFSATKTEKQNKTGRKGKETLSEILEKTTVLESKIWRGCHNNENLLCTHIRVTKNINGF